MAPLLGCIADDLTGGTDLASTLAQGGMLTALVTSPSHIASLKAGYHAIVVALKSRTIPARQAIDLSLQSLADLERWGARQIFFKYCSTFDSTPTGNIGPVADALRMALDDGLTIVCPVHPENGRTVYRGHLFVNDLLLAESSMRHHPLTPMTQSRIQDLLASQTRSKIGTIRYETIVRGPSAIRDEIEALHAGGCKYAIPDALTDNHLRDIGRAAIDLRLITGGSGIARGLPENFRAAGHLDPLTSPQPMRFRPGHAAIIAGSCSAATLNQIAHFKATAPAFKLDPVELTRDRGLSARTAHLAKAKLHQGPVLIYASAAPADVARAQSELGVAAASQVVEDSLAEIADALVKVGVTRLVVAGGETSGAVIGRLGLKALTVGQEIDPGVPWMFEEEGGLAVALKSGNFGKPDFFLRALATTS